MTEYLDDNTSLTDCLVVAIYNSLVAKGSKIDYEGVKKICTEKGWYVPYQGFKNNHLYEALEHFNLKSEPIQEVFSLQKLKKKIKKGNNVILLLQPGLFNICHATFAMKGKRGVKVYNGCAANTGWRTLCRMFKNNHFYIYEVQIS